MLNHYEQELFLEAEAIYASVRRHGSKKVSDAAELSASPDGSTAVFSGYIAEELQGLVPTRICCVSLITGAIDVLTDGPGTDRLPKYSPDGNIIAFLSDRQMAGSFQLYLMDVTTRTVRAAPTVDGWVEYIHWSPDGSQVLLGVAGHGADVTGAQGATSTNRTQQSTPSWFPERETAGEDFRWRQIWIWDRVAEAVRVLPTPALNIWEATWCGNDRAVAVTSPRPEEGFWYSAQVHVIDIPSGHVGHLYSPDYQAGALSCAPRGRRVALVEACCSDRGAVAGDLHLVDLRSSARTKIETSGIDVTYAEWRSDRLLVIAGHRGFETVVAKYDVEANVFVETWASCTQSTRGFYATVAGLGRAGDCVVVSEGFGQAPEIAAVENGEYRPIRSLDLGYAKHSSVLSKAVCMRWLGPDGTEIQGWLLLPKGQAPFPLVMNVHGGPVWHWHPAWLGRSSALTLMLLKRGFAIFLPNPRGSSGRGQAFSKHVLGDMGGADAGDCLAGLDDLVASGVADPMRMGVMGVSYGGFMSAWLITQDSRFGAAVSVAPFTNLISWELTSNIPHFASIFVSRNEDDFYDRRIARSPVVYARNAKTPTLLISGALDRCTPPQQAREFHSALLRNSVESELLIYPHEGHGIRSFPASIDYASRVVAWFERHLSGSH